MTFLDWGTENRILPIYEMQGHPFVKDVGKNARRCHQWCIKKPYSDWYPFQIQQITPQTNCVEAKIRTSNIISRRSSNFSEKLSKITNIMKII